MRLLPLTLLFAVLISPVRAQDWRGVARIEIRLSAENEEKLRNDPRAYVPAGVSAFGQVWKNAGIHLKGTSTFQQLDGKPSFTVDLSRYSRAERGGKIHLNNSDQDESYLKEFLGTALFRQAEIPAPNVAHASVTLNGRALGLYVLKEGFTREFLERYRLRGKLLEGASGVDSLLRGEKLEDQIVLDEFVRFMAVEVMIGHWDGYSLGMNNYRALIQSCGKVRLLPIGMDQLFGNPESPWCPDMTGALARAAVASTYGREAYAREFRALLGTVLDTNRIGALVAGKLAELQSDLSASEFESIQREAALLQERVARREQSLRAQLATAEPGIPRFVDGVAALPGAIQLSGDPQKPALSRISVRLPAGSYTFGGWIKTEQVQPLPFGKSHGATLRIQGDATRSAPLLGSRDWEKASVTFELSSERKVVLLCELRASFGQAWFRDLFIEQQRSGIVTAKFELAPEFPERSSDK